MIPTKTPRERLIAEFGRDALCRTTVDGNPVMRDSLEDEWCGF